METQFEKLEELIKDDDKIVTVASLAQIAKISIQESQELINNYVKLHKESGEIYPTYILNGKSNGDLLISQVNDGNIEEVKKLYESEPTVIIFSIQRAKSIDYNIISLVQPKNGDSLVGQIIGKNCVKRVLTKKILPTLPAPTIKGKSTIFSKQNNAKSEEKIIKSEENDTKSNKAKPTIASMFKGAQNKKSTQEKPKKINGGLSNFLTKQPPSIEKVVEATKKEEEVVKKSKKEEEKVVKNPKKEEIDPNKSSADLFDSNDDDIMKDLATTEEEIKSKSDKKEEKKLFDSDTDDDGIMKDLAMQEEQSKKTKPTKKKPIKNNKRKKIEETSSSSEKTAKRRKRIIVEESDSSDDMFAGEKSENEESEQMMIEEQEPVKVTAAAVLPIPKNKRRKAVKKMFEDDEGFIVTEIEYVYETASEDEIEVKIKPLIEKKSANSEQEISPNKAKTKKGAKKAVAANQPTLMNFFKKK